MIRVDLQPEPCNFDRDVRRPGNRFLHQKQPKKSKEFKNYWKNIKSQLAEAYSKICAYTCCYVIDGSVDHFIPKVARPDLAYEWSNYRWASPRVNQYKAESEEVIDPFVVENGWFVLDVPSCLIKAASDLPEARRRQVEKTIQVLKLNDDDTFVQERCDIIMSLVDGEIDLRFLRKRFPFLAFEIERQGIVGSLQEIFRRRQ